jgi:hypothetical protein
MIVKAINDTIKFDELMSTLLIFEAYSRMHVINSSTSSINQRAMTIEKAMTEMRKFRTERQVEDALNTRNDLIVTSIHDLLLNLNVLILWWERNAKSQNDQKKKNVDKHHRRQKIKIILFLSLCCVRDSEKWSFRLSHSFYETRLTLLVV